jgi:hypothetical protein
MSSGMPTFVWFGSLATVPPRAVMERCQVLAVSARAELRSGDQRARIDIVGGEVVAIDGVDPKVVAGWTDGSFRVTQLLPDLEGALREERELKGALGETGVTDLLLWGEEHRMSATLDLYHETERAHIELSGGRVAEVIVDGRHDLAALARLESWRQGEWRAALRPLFIEHTPEVAMPDDGLTPTPMPVMLMQSVDQPPWLATESDRSGDPPAQSLAWLQPSAPLLVTPPVGLEAAPEAAEVERDPNGHGEEEQGGEDDSAHQSEPAPVLAHSQARDQPSGTAAERLSAGGAQPPLPAGAASGPSQLGPLPSAPVGPLAPPSFSFDQGAAPTELGADSPLPNLRPGPRLGVVAGVVLGVAALAGGSALVVKLVRQRAAAPPAAASPPLAATPPLEAPGGAGPPNTTPTELPPRPKRKPEHDRPPPSRAELRDRARRLVDKGRREIIEGHRKAAVATLEEARKLEPDNAAIRIYLAQAHGKLGDGTLTVESTPRGARVVIDGAPVGTTPLKMKLPAGQHTVEVGDRVEEIEVPRHKKRDLRVNLGGRVARRERG